MDGQGTTWRRNIAENFNRLSRAHQRYRRQTDDRRQTDRQTDRQTTDGRPMTYSERELECTHKQNLKITLYILGKIMHKLQNLAHVPVVN